jgi:hypothetical protein
VEGVNNSIKYITKSVMITKNLNYGLKLNLAVVTVRFAYDLLLTASNKYLIKTFILPQIEMFLRIISLELSKEKTKVFTGTEGLDFLGYILNYREQ